MFRVPHETKTIFFVFGQYYDNKNQLIHDVRLFIDNKLINHVIEEYNKFFLKEREEINNIIRSIEFPPEYHQAGLTILNYFGTLINQRYPEIPVTVRIEQEGLKVRLTIQTPGGHREIVEQTLQAYGLVVRACRRTPLRVTGYLLASFLASL
jgi:hypothetical protein